MILFIWIVSFVFNLYAAIALAGTLQSFISLLFVALSAYFIYDHVRKNLVRK